MKETNNGMCALAYLLFFVPLIVDGSNEDYRFHANQGLLVFLIAVAGWIIGLILSFTIVLWILAVILKLACSIFALVLMIMGIINALNGEQKELPLVGGIRLIK